jgi:RNA ligase (TIGR02306 family)
MERKLASIQTIVEVRDIPGADRIQVAKVNAWETVIRKDEYKAGDLCIFCEVDSILPFAPWSDFLRDKKNPEKPIRLRTLRLKKQLSQGLALPLSILPETIHQWEVGEDVTEKLGIVRYDPPIPTCLAGQVKRPFPTELVDKTDELRVQSFPGLVSEFKGKEVYVSVKCDGTSVSFINFNGEMDVCSRNLSFKESDNVYWEMFKKYGVEDVLKRAGNYAIQAEICGEGIQKNRLGLKGHEIFVFNVYDVNNHRYLDYKDFIEFCKTYGLPTVPIIETCIFDFMVEQLLDKAKGKYSSGKDREGIVIRPTQEFYSEILSGRASFKALNNDFLEKDEE